jgi:signal transduction histidine kinase/CHASE2 domain-containing sensor protein
MTDRRAMAYGLAVAGLMALVSLVPLGPLRVFEHKTLDVRFKVREMFRRSQPAAAAVHLIAVDDAAVRALGAGPGLTAACARAVRAVLPGSRALGFDVPAAFADSTGVQEAAARRDLVAALESSPDRVVVMRPRETSAVVVDDDGVARRVRLLDGDRPTFVLRFACAALGVAPHGLRPDRTGHLVLRDAAGRVVQRIPVDAQGRMLVDYRRQPRTAIGLAAAIESPPAARFALLGTTARSLSEAWPTPIERRTVEVDIVAGAVESILAGRFVRQVPIAVQLLVNAIFLGAAALLLFRLPSGRAVLVGLGLMALYVVTEKVAFLAGGVWLDFMRPMVALQAALVAFPLWGYTRRNRALLEEMGEVRRFDDMALHLMTSGLLATDATGHVVKANTRAAAFLGRDGEKLEGRTLHELFAPSPDALEFLHRVMPVEPQPDEGPSCSLVPHRAPIVYPGRDGDDLILDLTVSVSDSLHLSESQRGGRVYVLTFSDVTEQVRLAAEDERRARLAAMGEIAAKLGHEIRNSLGGLRLYVENVRDETEPGSAGRRAIDNMVEEIASLTNKIQELREYARDPQLELSDCDVRQIVDDALLFARERLRAKNIQVVIEAPPQLPRLRLDRRQMRDAFQNLIQNALDAAPPGGRLRLVLETVAYSNGIGPAGACVVHVEDDGPGIPPAVGEQIFSLFFTTKADGTGLGLPMVKKIVESHGGSVTYRSQPGCTRFTVVLPPAGVRGRPGERGNGGGTATGSTITSEEGEA